MCGGWWGEEDAQGTVEYAIVFAAVLAIALGCAALWRAASDGALADAASEASSHTFTPAGAVDISLY